MWTAVLFACNRIQSGPGEYTQEISVWCTAHCTMT